ncbi:hypothetical protein PybrP1_008027, partial [[Pythium] brassicae (nom. inval.)]
MAKGVTKPKTQQRSIASFFASPPPVKRKAPDQKEDASTSTSKSDTSVDAEKNDEREAKPAAKKAKLAAAPGKSAQAAKAAMRKTGAGEEEPEEEVGDVGMSPVERDASGDEDDEDEKVVAAPSRAKPGRRRLRQRVDDSDDDDDDDDFGLVKQRSLATKPAPAPASAPRASSKEVPIDLASSDEEAGEESTVRAKSARAVAKAAKEPAAPAVEEAELKVATGGSDEDKGDDAEEVKTASDEPVTTDAEKEVELERAIAEPAAASPKPKISKPQAGDGFFGVHTEKAKATPEVSAASPKADSAATDAAPSSIPYAALAHLFNTIEATSSRLAIQELLLTFFRDVIRRAPQDLLACIYLCVCTDLAPPFENLKIGIGDAILMKAIGEATGTNMKFIKEMYQKEGDLGKVAQNARSKQHTLSFASAAPAAAKASALGVQDVYSQFVKIAKMTGNNSQQQKCSIIKSLLVKCEKDRKSDAGSGTAAEGAKYIIRGLQGKLRIGLAEKSILIGLTYAFMLEKDAGDKEKQQAALAHVKKAFAECPSYNALVAAFQEAQAVSPTRPLLRGKDFATVAERCVLTPGTPVSPMLARPTKAYAMVFDRFQGMPFTCEYKYDGERAQIHILPSGDIAIFSRNFENSTERFPDVKLAIATAAKRSNITSCIVDAEVVAVDKATNKRLPFQILSTRSRKNVKVEDIKVPVCIYAFDLLFLDGESYLTKPLADRRSKLKEVFELADGTFELATSIDVEATDGMKDDADAMEVAVDTVRKFLEEAVRENCEGLMVKTLQKEATYEPANRSHKWLKLKKDYLDGIGDSTDLVPIGAFYGRGKRTGVYGAYLLACYDPETEMFQPITKLGTGLSDEVLKQFYEQLKEKA